MGPKGMGAVGDEEEKEEGERMEGGCVDRREKRHEGQYASSAKYSRTPLAQFRLFGMLDRKKLYSVSHIISSWTLASSGQRWAASEGEPQWETRILG